MSGGLGASLAPLGDAGGAFGPPSIECDVAARFEDQLTAVKRYDVENDAGIGVAPVLSYAYRLGPIIADVVRIQQADSEKLTYTWTVAEQIHMAQALNTAAGAVVVDGMTVAPAMAVSLGVSLLQSIGMAPLPLPTLKYTQALVDSIGLSPQLGPLLGAALGDGIGMAPVIGVMFSAQPVLGDGIGVAPVLSPQMRLAVLVSEAVNINAANVLQMIYDGQLADDVQVITGYVSPNGNFTTWAMNTRNASVTEYSNYVFNSFAKVGNLYYGASSAGLYQLIGDDDAGAAIIATLRSGRAQWASTKPTLVRGAYLGLRGGGNFVLKIITGDGQTYIYSVTALSEATTKIKLGKGIRSRYVSFELTNVGQDFELDTIEFVPLISDRHV